MMANEDFAAREQTCEVGKRHAPCTGWILLGLDSRIVYRGAGDDPVAAENAFS